MLSKTASSRIFWVTGMTRPGIEPQSLGPLANTLLIKSIYIYAIFFKLDNVKLSYEFLSYYYILYKKITVCVCVCVYIYIYIYIWSAWKVRCCIFPTSTSILFKCKNQDFKCRFFTASKFFHINRLIWSLNFSLLLVPSIYQSSFTSSTYKSECAYVHACKIFVTFLVRLLLIISCCYWPSG